MSSLPFRFNAAAHEYIALDTGEVVPHITGMLTKALDENGKPWIDDEYFTDESCVRGTAVHDLTLEFDLGALEVETCISPYRGYLLGHVEAMRVLQPQILKVEEAQVHPVYRYAGRTDRVLRMFDAAGVLEVKSGQEHKAHRIQTALQAILECDDLNLPAHRVKRWGLYLKANGRYKLVEFKDRRDFDKAYKIIEEAKAA